MSKSYGEGRSWADLMNDPSPTLSTPGRHTAALYQTTPSSKTGPELTYEVSPNIYTYPIKHDDPFIDYWDHELLKEIIHVIRRTPLWLAIDVLRRGILDEGQDCPVTIVFTIAAKAFDNKELNEIFIKIQSIVMDTMYAGLYMEVREGTLQEYTLHNHLGSGAVQKKPNLGHSLGPCTHPSKTIGGYVTVKHVEFPSKRCLLTALHVVQEPPFRPLDPPCWTVDSRKFRIFATSGHYVHYSGCALEWALVEVDPESKGDNTIPHTPRFQPLSLPARVETIRAVDADKDVIKFGRITSLTVGKMSHIRSCLRIPGVLGKTPMQFNDTTRETVFVGSEGGVFAEEGDSGAWIINREDGALVALLWGGQGPGCQWSYATPISTVFDDIRSRLHASVEVTKPWVLDPGAGSRCVL